MKKNVPEGHPVGGSKKGSRATSGRGFKSGGNEREARNRPEGVEGRGMQPVPGESEVV